MPRRFRRSTRASRQPGGAWSARPDFPPARALRFEALEDRSLMNATPVGAEFRVNTATAGDQTNSTIAQDAAGNFVIAWIDNQQKAVFAQRYDATGTSQGGPITVISGFPFFTFTFDDLDIAMDDAGEFVVTWSLTDSMVTNSTYDIFARRFDSSGAPLGNQFTVNTTTAFDQKSPDVAMDQAGDFVVIWIHSSSIPQVRGQLYGRTGAKLGVEFVVASVSNSTFAQVAMDAAGGFVVSYANVVYRYGADGTLRNTLGLPNWTAINVAMQSEGTAWVKYISNQETFVQRYNDYWLPKGPPINVTSPTAAAELYIAPGGNFVLTGVKQTFTPTGSFPPFTVESDVYARAFTAGGIPSGPEFRLNGFTSGNQSGGGVIVRDNGDFVAVWSSSGQDGSGYGVYARRFIDINLATVALVMSGEGEYLTAGATFHSQLPRLRVMFSRPMIASGSGSVTNPTNWQLSNDGNDISSSIAAITTTGNQATLVLDKPLRGGSFQLTARGAMLDNLSNNLDGDANGTAGGDFTWQFATPANVFGVGDEFFVAPINMGPVQFPQVSIAPRGDFAIAWRTQTNTAALASWALYDSVGAPSGPITQVNGSPAWGLANDSRGNYLLAESFGGSAYIQPFAGAGPNGPRKVVYSQSQQVPFPFDANPSVAADAAGNYVVVWADNANNASNILAQRYDRNLQTIGGTFQVNTYVPNNQINPDVAMNAVGDIVIVWSSEGQDSGGYGIFGQRYGADGLPRGSEFQINTTALGSVNYFANSPKVAMDSVGNFSVTWPSNTPNGNYAVRAQRFDANGNRLGPERQVNSASATGTLPDIAMDAVGRSIVVWGQLSPARNVFAQAFDSDGQILGALFQVNTLSAPFGYPRISMNAIGDAVVVWANDETNIYAQRLSLDHAALVDLNGPTIGSGYAATFTAGGPAVPIVDNAQMYIADAAVEHLNSARVAIDHALAGDLLSVSTTGTSIAASFADGVLTLSGMDSVAHYEQVLRTLTFSTTAARQSGSEIYIAVTADDGVESAAAYSTVTFVVPGATSIEGRRVFYNNSAFDGNDPAAGDADDDAIASDKSALLPGGTAAFANVTSYDKGINGVMIDLAGTLGSISLEDFAFKVGDDNSPDGWNVLTTLPSITIRAGKGTNGSDRIELIWPDGAIKNTFLEITVRSNDVTRLALDDVFYFGNLVGDSGRGNEIDVAFTDAIDVIATRVITASDVPVTDPLDYNRDGSVDGTDVIIARANSGELALMSLAATNDLAGAVLPADAGMVADGVAFSLALSPSVGSGSSPPVSRTDTSIATSTASVAAQPVSRGVDAVFAVEPEAELSHDEFDESEVSEPDDPNWWEMEA